MKTFITSLLQGRYLIAALSSLLIAGSLSATTVLLDDNFDGTHISGTLLQNSNVASGTLSATNKWGGQNVVQYGTNAITTYGTSGRRVYINLDSMDMPKGESILSYSISANSSLAAIMYIGFSSYEGANPYDIGQLLNSDYGQIYISSQYSSATETTTYFLYYNNNHVIATGSYSGSGLVEYNITYDFATNTIVSASINGTTITSNYDLDDVGFTPNIQAIQLQYSTYKGALGDALADNLSVTSIPEASQSSLLTGGALLLLVLLFRQRR
jgi:hypothetical protein